VVEQPTGDVGNAFQAGGSKAGSEVTFEVAGLNQANFFATAPLYSGYLGGDQAAFRGLNLIPGAYAFIPAGVASNYGEGTPFGSEVTWPAGKYDDEWDTFTPPFQYTHLYNKASVFTDRIIYQRWDVKETTPGAIDSIWYWELDTVNKWYQDFTFNLQGYVYYSGDGGASVQKWVDNGAAYPAFKSKRKGFKFGGWFTKFPTGGSKITPGKDKVWFGDGYYKYLYVHWDKKVKITYNPNKGKISKGKKTVTVKYRGKLGKAPTAKRTGYTSLGWYFGKKHQLHEKKLIVLVPKATFKAEWIKNGKDKTVSAAEWSRVLKAAEKGLAIKYKSAKAAIGGGGTYNGVKKVIIGSVGYITYYIECKAYEWNGNVDGTVIAMYFSTSTGNLISLGKNGGLK
jgi:hypothetical protein